jgi:hypothetical protein
LTYNVIKREVRCKSGAIPVAVNVILTGIHRTPEKEHDRQLFIPLSASADGKVSRVRQKPEDLPASIYYSSAFG